MMFEYIRPIDPSPAALELEPVRNSDGPELAELVACASTLTEDTAPLSCPELSARRLDLPLFSGMSLGEVVQLATTPAPEPDPALARVRTPMLATAMPLEPRVLLGPGAMTMTLAVVATLVFGMAVASQVY